KGETDGHGLPLVDRQIKAMVGIMWLRKRTNTPGGTRTPNLWFRRQSKISAEKPRKPRQNRSLRTFDAVCKWCEWMRRFACNFGNSAPSAEDSASEGIVRGR